MCVACRVRSEIPLPLSDGVIVFNDHFHVEVREEGKGLGPVSARRVLTNITCTRIDGDESEKSMLVKTFIHVAGSSYV